MKTSLNYALEEASYALAASARAIAKAARALEASAEPAAAVDPDWLRLPRDGERCPILGLSRRQIERLITEGKLRSHRRNGARYYSARSAKALAKPRPKP